MVKRSDILWYAMRITYSRELALKEYLDSLSVNCYVPMHYEVIIRNDQKQRKLVPVVHNLIFIYSSRIRIDSIKAEVESRLPMRYIMDRGTNLPIIVPEKQMRDFIVVSGTNDESLVYLNSSEVFLKKGSRVRVTGGPFCGVEGKLIRIKGDRRVVIALEGLMAVATAFIHPSLLEPIE